jgi:hypothetical protein
VHPQVALSVFTPVELEMLLCGTPDIDVDDWQKHTVYHDLQPSSAVVQWFWETVREMTAAVCVCVV